MGRLLRRMATGQGATFATIGTAFWGQAALIISGPIAARLLGVENRGYLALLVLFPTILAQVGHLGVPQLIPYFSQGNRERVRLIGSQVVRLGLLQALSMTVLHVLILMAYVHGRPRELQVAAAMTIVLVPASLMRFYGLAMLQARRDFGAFNALRAAQPTLYSAGLLWCLLSGNSDLLTVIVVWVISGVVSGIVTLRAGFGKRSNGYSTDPLPSNLQIARSGLVAYLGAVSPLESFRLDQLIAGLMLSPAALGLYVVGLAFSSLPRFIGESVGMVAYPHVVSEHDPSKAFGALWRFFWLAAVICSLLALGLLLTVHVLVPFFFGSDFTASVPLARILIVGGLFLSLKRVVSDGLRGVGLGRSATAAELASWFVLVPLLLILPRLIGVEGVAISFASSALVGLSLVLFRVRRESRLGVGTIEKVAK